MFGLGTQELLIIMVVAGLLFGGKKLPELGRGLGEAIRGFKKSISDTEETVTLQKPAEKVSSEAAEKEGAKT